MRIEKINITKENMWEVIHDNSVYGLKKTLLKGEYFTVPIMETSIEDIISKKITLIRIIEEES